MANDVTTLTLAVDTTDVKTASQTLNQMATAGNSAAASTTRLEKANAAMVAELKRIGAGISELVKLTAAEGRAAQAVTQRSKASAAAALASTKAAAALRTEAKAVEALAPSATISAGAMQKLSLSAASINSSGVKELTQELSAAATQANRTAIAVNSIKPAVVATTNQAQQVVGNTKSSVPNNLAGANNAAANATRNLSNAQRAQAKEASNAAFKNTQLGFQLQDFFVQVQAGQNPLTAFIQQGSQLAGTFGGAGNAFRAVIGLITPFRVAIAGVAGAIGSLAFAFYEGSKQSKAFADAIVLTGNFAGQTEDKFNSLAKAVSRTGQVTISASREAAQAVLTSGQFGPQVFAQATEATALFAEATGQTADEVVKDFSRMSRGVAKWAADTNRSMHFLTAAQVDLIRSFEEQGRTIEAQSVVFDALNNRLKQLDPNLGTIERTLRTVKNGWESFWDAAYDVGRTETIGDKLNKVNQQIEEADRTKEFTNKVLGRPAGTGSGASEALLQQRSQLTREQFRQSEEADRKAVDAQIQQRAIDAGERIKDGLRKADPARVVKEALAQVERDIKDREIAGFVVSEAEKGLLRANARGKTKSSSGGGEANQILRAQLDQDIKSIQDVLAQERDAFAFNERFLQGQYQAGQKSLKDYYDARRDASTQGIQAEIAAIELENQKLAEFRAKSKDPSERIQAQTRIDENTAQINRLRAQGIRELELLNQEAASSFKQLDESVSNYNATLEQLLGNEEKAAEIRAAIAIQNARVLSSQKGGTVIDVAAYERALNIQNQFNEVQRRSSTLAAAGRTAEEAFAEAVESRGLSLRDTETGVYKIRQEQLRQLGDLVTKAQELAEASTNPAVKQFAADLAVEYAKAAKAVDPALQRLKDANRDLAQTIANTLTNLPQTFSDSFSRRRQEASDDIRSEKDEYNRRIDQLEQYLAESSDKQDKARLRERIKALQDEKGNLKKESRASSFFKTIGETILAPIGQQVLSTITKVAVSDPLQKMLENSLNSLTTGDGILGQIFKDAFGVKTDPKDIAKSQEIAAITATTTALQALEAAANAAASALPTSGGIPSVNGNSGVLGVFDPSQDEVNGILGDFGASIQDAEAGNKDFAKAVPAVTNVLSKLTGVTSDATSALSILPSIINLISAAGASSSASSAGSGLIGLFGSLFSGGGGSSAAASGAMTNVLFHNGGIAGQGTQRRSGGVASMFNNATRYHSGGIAGLQPDEVPAILMGGPKGRREEILTAKDPRHRDNLLKPQNRPYMAGQHSGNVNNTTNNKSQQINMELNFHTGGAPVDRRSGAAAGAAAYQQLVKLNKRYG